MSLYREYTTIAKVKSHKMPDTVTTRDDTLILDMIRDVCQIIDRQTGFAFYPLIETRKFDAFRDVDGYQLLFDRRALAITEVTNAGIGTVVAPTSYVTDPRNETPYYGITLLRSAGIVWYFNVDPENALTVTATWGYHKRYADAWQVLTTLSADVTSGATTLTVPWSALTTLSAAMTDTTSTAITLTDAVGVIGETLLIGTEQMYLSNRTLTTATVIRGFNGTTAATHLNGAAVSVGAGEPGQLLKIDSEFLYLSARTGVTNTVVRAVNGSTAAAHTSGATVYYWYPEEGIEQLAREATVLKIIMRNDPTAIQVTIDGQAFSVPKNIDAYIAERLRGLGFAARVG